MSTLASDSSDSPDLNTLRRQLAELDRQYMLAMNGNDFAECLGIAERLRRARRQVAEEIERLEKAA